MKFKKNYITIPNNNVCKENFFKMLIVQVTSFWLREIYYGFCYADSTWFQDAQVLMCEERVLLYNIHQKMHRQRLQTGH